MHIKDNNNSPHVKFHRFLFPFSSKLLDQNFAPYWGARNGAVLRALASHQCGPGSNPIVDAICQLSLLFVLSFGPRGFSPGTPVFPSPQKPTFSNSNSTRNQVDEEPLCGCATSKSLFIFHYLFIYYLYVRYIYSCDEPRTWHKQWAWVTCAETSVTEFCCESVNSYLL